MPGESLKATAPDYRPAPFFCVEESRPGKRLVAWTSDLPRLKRLMYGLLRSYPVQAEVLLQVNIDQLANRREPEATFYGSVSRTRLLDVILDNERYVFQDGSTQLTVRQAETGEYLQLDEHALVLVYPHSTTVASLCRRCGFAETDQLDIRSVEHVHQRPPDADVLQRNFIGTLMLQRLA